MSKIFSEKDEVDEETENVNNGKNDMYLEMIGKVAEEL
ncbi:unnamed protein product, partial [Brachionus calyciflorus]